MSSSVPVAALPSATTISLFPTLEPGLVEVIVPFSTGTVDEAVRQASAMAEATVQAAINALTGNASSLLDTLAEIDAAINNDPNFATTVMTALATKALRTTKVTTDGLATGGGDLTQDRTISVPKATVTEGKAGTLDTKAITPLVLNAVITWLLTEPGVLQAILPSTLPAQPGVPWINGGVVAIS